MIYNSIAVFDLNGNVLAQSQGAILSNHRDRDYFQAALKTNQPVISEPSVSKSSGILSIHTAAPMKDKVTGQTIAIVRARLPVSHLHELLSTIVEGQEGHNDAGMRLYLADRQGQVFAGSEDSYATLKNKIDATSIFPAYKETKQSNLAGAKTDFKQLWSFASMPKYQDSFRSELPNLGWNIFAGVDKSTAFASRRQLLVALTLGTATAAVAVGFLAAWIANQATKPIVAAATATEKIGQGDLSTRLTVTGEDELSTLGNNINLMATRLQGILREQAIAAEKAQFLTSVTAASRAVTEEDLSQMFDRALDQAQQFLGVDRVVIYRFNPNWSGYVSNESVVPGYPKALHERIVDVAVYFPRDESCSEVC